VSILAVLQSRRLGHYVHQAQSFSSVMLLGSPPA